MVRPLLIAQVLGLQGNLRQTVRTRYRRGAQNRGLSFALSNQEFDELLELPCHYCGGPPANVLNVTSDGFAAAMPYQGVDRVDNARGYEPGNVVPCCRACNVAKGAQSVETFLAHAARVVGLGR